MIHRFNDDNNVVHLLLVFAGGDILTPMGECGRYWAHLKSLDALCDGQWPRWMILVLCSSYLADAMRNVKNPQPY
jgi:hypothetical protein